MFIKLTIKLNRLQCLTSVNFIYFVLSRYFVTKKSDVVALCIFWKHLWSFVGKFSILSLVKPDLLRLISSLSYKFGVGKHKRVNYLIFCFGVLADLSRIYSNLMLLEARGGLQFNFPRFFLFVELLRIMTFGDSRRIIFRRISMVEAELW